MVNKISEDYALKLFGDFEHDYIDRYLNKRISMAENIFPYTLCMFSLVTEKDGDLNKVIADA